MLPSYREPTWGIIIPTTTNFQTFNRICTEKYLYLNTTKLACTFLKSKIKMTSTPTPFAFVAPTELIKILVIILMCTIFRIINQITYNNK